MSLELQEKNSVLNEIIGILMPEANCDLAATMALQKGRSFLFVGTDKKKMLEALDELAKCITCSSADKAAYCNCCINCRMVSQRQHPDVLWVCPRGTSATIKIEDIRRLKERISLKPYQAQKKLFIIEDAERLSPASANALLKTLEEPPSDTLVVLICQSASQLLPTVVSRCQLIRFPVSSDAAEDVDNTDELVVRFFEADDFLVNDELCKDIAAIDRSSIEQLLQELVFIFRDILITKLGADKGMLLSRQPQANIIRWTEIFDTETLPYLLDEILRTKSYIRKNANIKLSIDLLVKTIKSYRLF